MFKKNIYEFFVYISLFNQRFIFLVGTILSSLLTWIWIKIIFFHSLIFYLLWAKNKKNAQLYFYFFFLIPCFLNIISFVIIIPWLKKKA